MSFPLTQSKSGPVPDFRSDLQSGSNRNSTKFAIVRIQSNPSPVKCSSLLRRRLTLPKLKSDSGSGPVFHIFMSPVSSEISDLGNFWLHTMYACTE